MVAYNATTNCCRSVPLIKLSQDKDPSGCGTWAKWPFVYAAPWLSICWYVVIFPELFVIDWNLRLELDSWVPRIDELDDSIVSYWCNLRTEGKMLNRQATKLQEKVHAKGVTDSFSVELFPHKMDLKSMGHVGPAKLETKNKQAGKCGYATGNPSASS